MTLAAAELPNIRMSHAASGNEAYAHYEAYRAIWYDLGWRSTDDPWTPSVSPAEPTPWSLWGDVPSLQAGSGIQITTADWISTAALADMNPGQVWTVDPDGSVGAPVMIPVWRRVDYIFESDGDVTSNSATQYHFAHQRRSARGVHADLEDGWYSAGAQLEASVEFLLSLAGHSAGDVLTAYVPSDNAVYSFVVGSLGEAWVELPTIGISMPEDYGDALAVLTADGLRFLETQDERPAIMKSSDTARQSTTALAADPELVVTGKVNQRYHVRGVIFYVLTAGGNTDGLRIGFDVPSGATLKVTAQGPKDGSTGSASDGQFGAMIDGDDDTTNYYGGGAGTEMGIQIEGYLEMGTVAGDLEFLWAQRNSNATDTTVKAGSFLTLEKI